MPYCPSGKSRRTLFSPSSNGRLPTASSNGCSVPFTQSRAVEFRNSTRKPKRCAFGEPTRENISLRPAGSSMKFWSMAPSG